MKRTLKRFAAGLAGASIVVWGAAAQGGAQEAAGKDAPNPALEAVVASKIPSDASQIKDPKTGAIIAVRGDGNCNDSRVYVGIPGNDGDVLGAEITYTVDEKCNVTVLKTETPSARELAQRVGAAKEGETLPMTKQPAEAVSLLSPQSTDSTSSTATVWGNYIHSSGTLQDIVFVDISRVRYHTDRKWDGSTSWWGAAWAGQCNAGANTPWNHLVSCVAWDLSDHAPTVETAAQGEFHSDWLWCNLQAGQNFAMINDHQSAWQGSFAAFFFQTKTCSGTHMTTQSWTSTNING